MTDQEQVKLDLYLIHALKRKRTIQVARMKLRNERLRVSAKRAA